LTAYHYFVHGLHIRSALRCPELMPIAADQSPVDVSICFGEAPATLMAPFQTGDFYQAQPHQLLVVIAGVARYLVTHGTEICVTPDAGANADAVRLYLLGSALGALLHQRGRFILHGSAVATSLGAVVFVGDSGAGKSTLAAALQQRGYRVLSDDVCAVSDGAGDAPLVYPSSAHIKLWADAAAHLARDTRGARRVHPDLDKFAFENRRDFDATPTPLHAVYALTIQHDPCMRIVPVAAAQKAHTLIAMTYRQEMLHHLGLRDQHFRQAIRIAAQIRVMQVFRPPAPFQLDALATLVEQDWTKRHDERASTPP
jgi:hypothetical protein